MTNFIKYLIFIITIFLFLLYFTGSYLIKAYPQNIGEIPSDLKNTREVSFPSKSGAQLSGWFLEAKQGKGGVLLLHGVKSNRLQMLNRARFLQKAGYNVLLFDFQAHGESNGSKITFGHLESLDASSAYDYLADRVCSPNIGVIGVSLGGASALLGDIKSKAKVLILESVYPTIEEAIKNRLKIYLGSIGSYFSSLLTLQLKHRLGVPANKLMPIVHLKNITGAVMIISGSKDKHTTPIETKRMFLNAKEPKRLWIIEGVGHVNFDEREEINYKIEILSFLKKWM